MTTPTPASPEAAPDDPVGPFGATVAGAMALLPDTTLAPERPAPLAGARGQITRVITVGEVRGWVQELTATVALRVDGWTRLSDQVDPALYPVSDRGQLVLEARRLVHSGVASYVEAAHARANTSPTTEAGSYAAVLWGRFEDGLADLTGWLVGRLAGMDPTDEPEGSLSALAVGHFPPPSIGRGTRF